MKRSGVAVLNLASVLALFFWPATASAQAEGALSELRELDERVATAIFRLSVANKELCPRTRLLAGWTLQSADIYGPARRAEAITTFNLVDDLPNVLALVPDGPAAAQGIRVGDTLEAVNGQQFIVTAQASSDTGRPASYARLGEQIQALDEAFGTGDAVVTVSRFEERLELRITPEPGCAYEAQVIPSETFNGGADGLRISITSRLVTYATSDDDLAFLLAHELAHNILGHSERPRAADPLSAVFGRNGRTPAAVREAETAADRMGLFLAARAGYDVSGAPAFRRRFARDHAAARYALWGYPSGEARAQAHERTLKEIGALRSAGLPLTP